MKDYLYHNLIAIDQLVNAILGGYADETLSSRAWRAYEKGTRFGLITKPVIDALFFIYECDHCYKAYLSEIKRKQAPAFQKV